MSKYGYHYNVIQTFGEGWHILEVMEYYQQQYGYESFGTTVDKKTGVTLLLVRKPMTSQERDEANLKHAIAEERRNANPRYK